jgi:hypothetical protein
MFANASQTTRALEPLEYLGPPTGDESPEICPSGV